MSSIPVLLGNMDGTNVKVIGSSFFISGLTKGYIYIGDSVHDLMGNQQSVQFLSTRTNYLGGWSSFWLPWSAIH